MSKNTLSEPQPDSASYYFWELSDIFKCELCIKLCKANKYMAHTFFIQRTTSCFTGDSKESILFYSTNQFNSSWETNNSGCGLLRNPCHRSVSLQRVLPEMGCQTLSKCTKVTLPAPCILYTAGGGPGTTPPPLWVRRPLCPGGGWRDGCRDLEWKIDGRDKRGWQIIFLWLWYFLICIFAIVTLVCVSKIFFNGKRTWQKSVCLKKEILLFWLVRTNSFSHLPLMNPPSPARSCTCCTGLGTWLASDRSLSIVQYNLNHLIMEYFKTME